MNSVMREGRRGGRVSILVSDLYKVTNASSWRGIHFVEMRY